MARIGIVFGLLLCGLTAAALLGTPTKAPSEFVPMMVGIPILFLGVVGLNPHRRKHSMHVAATIGLIGLVVGTALAIYTGMRLGEGQTLNAYVFKLVSAMALICLVFVCVCVISFLQARTRASAEIAAKTGA